MNELMNEGRVNDSVARRGGHYLQNLHPIEAIAVM